MTFHIRAEPVPISFDEEGVARAGGTRVTLQTIVAAFHRGASPEAIAEEYDALDLSDIYVILGYYLQHRDEVDAYIRGQQQVAETLRLENDARNQALGLRERLLARLDEKSGR